MAPAQASVVHGCGYTHVVVLHDFRSYLGGRLGFFGLDCGQAWGPKSPQTGSKSSPKTPNRPQWTTVDLNLQPRKCITMWPDGGISRPRGRVPGPGMRCDFLTRGGGSRFGLVARRPSIVRNRCAKVCGYRLCQMFLAWFGTALGPSQVRNRRVQAGSLKVFGALSFSADKKTRPARTPKIGF
jgi:hypothetical protein